MAIEKSLKMDLPALAEMLRSKGRGKDTMLAHITPKEAALLKRRGGSGTTNPDTGLPEFDDSFDVGSYFGGDTGGAFTPAPGASFETPAPTYTPTPGTTAGFAETQRQEDFAQTPSSPYTDQSIYPGGVAPKGMDTVFTPSGQSYNITPGQFVAPTPTAPGVVSPEQQTAAPGTQAPGTQPPKDFTTQLKEALTPTNLAKLGLVGALGAYGANRARLGGQQTQDATQQQQNIATPYQQQGAQLTGAALRGELTPQSQQAYQAAQAQINQGIANRGGVGTQQAANQLASIYQNLLNNQYTYGLQVSQIGDNISLGAIRTGLQLDQQLNQATTGFYTQLAALAAGATVIPSYGAKGY